MGSALGSKFLKSATFGVKRGSDGHFRYPIVRMWEIPSIAEQASKQAVVTTDYSISDKSDLNKDC